MIPALNLLASSTASPLFLAQMVGIFAIFYFLVLRPMQKQKKETQSMLENLKKGDVVVTNGGLVGTVVDLNPEDNTIVIRVKPDNVKLQLARNAVSGLHTSASPASS